MKNWYIEFAIEMFLIMLFYAGYDIYNTWLFMVSGWITIIWFCEFADKRFFKNRYPPGIQPDNGSFYSNILISSQATISAPR